jgi:hypothetical protein
MCILEYWRKLKLKIIKLPDFPIFYKVKKPAIFAIISVGDM